MNNVSSQPQDLFPLFQDINFYQDSKGKSVLLKLDDLFNLHQQYTAKFPDQYPLLNTSLHDSTNLCLLELLNVLKLEINSIIDCLAQKRDALDSNTKRVTRGLKVDTTLKSFYNGYINSLSPYLADIEFLQSKLQSLPINSTFESEKIKVDLSNDSKIYSELQKEFGLTSTSSGNRIDKISNFKEIVDTSAFAASIATLLMKFANDIRFLSSGPRSGFGEMVIPENEPGSSIMPGKVNPTQCESLTMVATQVIGNNNAVLIASSSNLFEGGNYLPLIANNTVRSVLLLSDGIKSFRKNCMEGADFIQTTLKKELDSFL